MCNSAISHNEFYSKLGKSGLEADLQEDEEKYKKFMSSCYDPYVAERNANSGRRVARKIEHNRRVEATQSSYIQGRMCVGILWPTSIFRKKFNLATFIPAPKGPF